MNHSLESKVRANLRMLRSAEFTDVLMRESCGGNAGHGCVAVNFAARGDWIIALGNYQTWPTFVQLGIAEGTLIHGTILVKVVGDGPAYRLVMPSPGDAIDRAIEILNRASPSHLRNTTPEDLLAQWR